MVKTYLEERIMMELREKDLIEKDPKIPVAYQPPEPGKNYRALRRIISNNKKLLSLPLIPAWAYFMAVHPVIVGGLTLTGFGVGGAIKQDVINPFDKLFYRNPADVGKSVYKTIPGTWDDTYNNVHKRLNSTERMIDFVYMAHAAGAVGTEHGTQEEHKKLGIAIGAVADKLREITVGPDSTKLGRLVSDLRIHSIGKAEEVEQRELIRMILDQKPRDPTDEVKISYLKHSNHTEGELSKMLDKVLLKPEKYDPFTIDCIDTLRRYIDNYEFALQIYNLGDIDSVASQMSSGTVIHYGKKVGTNFGSYLGFHQNGGFPLVIAKAGAADDFAPKMRRGMAISKSKVGERALHGSLGGIGLIEGLADEHFAKNVDDKTWPMVAIAYDGIVCKIDDQYAHNGIIVRLNQDPGIEGPAKLYRFKNDQRTENITLEGDKVEEQVGDHVEKYLQEWTDIHRK